MLNKIVFENLTERLTNIFENLRRHGRLSESDVDEAMREVRMALLEADVHYSVVKSFTRRVKERALRTGDFESTKPSPAGDQNR